MALNKVRKSVKNVQTNVEAWKKNNSQKNQSFMAEPSRKFMAFVSW